MVWITFPEWLKATNETGLIGILLYSNYIWAGTTPLILFTLASVIFLSIYLGQKATTGEGNPIIAFAVAMTFILFISAILSLKSGLINVPTLAIVFTIWVVSIIGLFFSRDRGG